MVGRGIEILIKMCQHCSEKFLIKKCHHSGKLAGGDERESRGPRSRGVWGWTQMILV